MDTSKIEGYENMSVEEKLAALEAFEEPQTPPENVTKLKTALSKANSEAAEYKRLLREKQTEAERAEAERAEAEKSMREQLEALQKEKTMNGYKMSCLSLGYDEDLATATAQALADGDIVTFFANQKTFIANQKTRIEAESLNGQPGLTPGGVPTADEIEKQQIKNRREAFGLH